jgi:hypothetical protein
MVANTARRFGGKPRKEEMSYFGETLTDRQTDR